MDHPQPSFTLRNTFWDGSWYKSLINEIQHLQVVQKFISLVCFTQIALPVIFAWCDLFLRCAHQLFKCYTFYTTLWHNHSVINNIVLTHIAFYYSIRTKRTKNRIERNTNKNKTIKDYMWRKINITTFQFPKRFDQPSHRFNWRPFAICGIVKTDGYRLVLLKKGALLELEFSKRMSDTFLERA